MSYKERFSKYDIEATHPLEKLALYSTVNPDGLPHITFVNSLMANSESELTFGQFIRGQSKWFMQNNSKTGFFILSPKMKRMWRGTSLYREKKDDGAELEKYKEMPMQRYNSYFPINRVHYLDLVKTTEPLKIPIFSALKTTLLTRAAKKRTGKRNKEILNYYSEELFNRITSLKFMSFVDSGGFPMLFPLFGACSEGGRKIIFNLSALRKDIDIIPDGTMVAVYALSLKLESVLVRGVLNKNSRRKGIKFCTVDINWVYNSMPPNAGQIYPPVELEAVRDF